MSVTEKPVPPVNLPADRPFEIGDWPLHSQDLLRPAAMIQGSKLKLLKDWEGANGARERFWEGWMKPNHFDLF
ncbi:MAG: hypothetical protein GY821_11800 [Gammaproteobacteria bacterium]|nr:hypothetical protein [Gammaproteobacteria bacterium]